MRRIILFLFAVIVVAAWTLPADAAEVTFDGQWRTRLFAVENADFDERAAANDGDNYIEQRARTGITARSSDDFGGYLQLEAGSRTWGTGGGDSATSTTICEEGAPNICTTTTTVSNSITTRLAYLDFNIQNVNVKTGRLKAYLPGDTMKLVYVGINDSVVASTTVGPATITGIYIKVTEDATAIDNDRDVYALAGTFAPVEGTNAGVFWAMDRDGTTPSVKHFIGASGNFAAGPVGLALEGVIRTGSEDTDNTAGSCTGTTDCDFSGWAIAADANMAPNDQVTVGLAAGFSGGDDDGDTDNDRQTFQGISPSYNASAILFDAGADGWGGYTGGSLANTPLPNGTTADLGGVIVIAPYAAFKVNDQLGLSARYAWFKYSENANSTLTTDDELGSELNLQADYTIHSASTLKLTAQANWFFPGDAVLTTAETAAGDPTDTVSEYTANLQYSF